MSPGIMHGTTAGWTGDTALDVALRAAGATSAQPLFPHPAHSSHAAVRPEALDRFWRVRFSPGLDPAATARHLATLPGIESAEAVPVCTVDAIPNDPNFASQWAFSEPAGHGVNATPAWDTAVGDSTTLIGDLDTGLDWHHPDLGGAPPYTNGSVWTNWIEANGITGVDDDADGYIDDIRGWDFVDMANVYPGEDGNTPDNDPSDFDGHGTHVGGIMAAQTNNATGVAGVTWKCKLVPLRMGYAGTDPYNGHEVAYVEMDFAAEAMTYATDHGVAAVNCSWGSNSFTAFATAVNYAIASDIAVVDAAGNGDSESQLGNYLCQRGDCIDVAAVDSLDRRAGFSSYGSWVDISAPGLDILSTYYDHVTGAHVYEWLSGTSQAAPFVTAAAALWRSAHPADSLGAFRERVLATSASIDDFNTSDVQGKLGWGRLDLGAMVSASASSWQASLRDSVQSSVAVGDLGPNHRGTVVACTSGGQVYALGAGGAMLPGWPVTARFNAPASSAAAPSPPLITRFGLMPVVVVSSNDGSIRAWSATGTMLPGQWPVRLDAAMRGSVASGNILGSGTALVAGTDAGTVWALDSTGTALPNWPQRPSSPVRATPTLVDLTGDGLRSIVAACWNGCVYAWNGSGAGLSGWPVCSPGAVFAVPVAAGTLSGVSGTLLVAHANDNRVFLWNRVGVSQPGWPVQLQGGGIPAPPVLADLALDGSMEVIATTGTKVFALRSDGTLLPGWPRTLPARIVSSAVVADLDNSGQNAILVACTNGRVYAFTAAGGAVPGWPRATGAAIEGSPAVGDAGGDGVPDVVVGSDDGWVYSWPLPGTVRGPDRLQWAMYGHDAEHSSRHTPLAETTAPAPAASSADELRAATVSDGRSCALRLPRASHGAVQLELYDLTGRRIASTRLATASGTVRWILASAGRRRVSSGVYLVRAQFAASAAAFTTRVLVLP